MAPTQVDHCIRALIDKVCIWVWISAGILQFLFQRDPLQYLYTFVIDL